MSDSRMPILTLAERVVAVARAQIGKPYQWGGENNPGFDCSGLVQWSYAQCGISIPRTSEQQAAGGQFVYRADLQPADVIVYYDDASHCALYSGNGNVIEASTYGVPVKEVPVDDAGPYLTARRYLQEPTTVTLFGVDTSNNNWSSIGECQNDIRQIQAEGFSWVEAKVSQGSGFRDAYWQATLDTCNEIGLPVVGYHYVDTSAPDAQAQCFVSNNGGSVAMLDFEANSGDIGNFWAVANAFNAAGVQVVLSYIPHWYWQEIGSPDLTGVPGLVSSDYVNGSGYASALYPGAGWGGWNSYGNATPVICQFTDAAVVAGMQLDANAFEGSLDDLTALLGGGGLTPQQFQQLIDLLTDIQTQLRGPNLAGWGQLGQNSQGQNLTVVDALAAVKTDIESGTAAGTHVTNVFTGSGTTPAPDTTGTADK